MKADAGPTPALDVMQTRPRCLLCGQPVEQGEPAAKPLLFLASPWFFGFEYRSKLELFGMPVIHVAYGFNPRTGLPRLAHGIIAIGNFALGLVAVGGFAIGGLVLGGIGIGFLTLAGVALGWMAVGGIAVGGTFALGGLAISLHQAIGGLPLILYILTYKD